jgi:hypothetical protein
MVRLLASTHVSEVGARTHGLLSELAMPFQPDIGMRPALAGVACFADRQAIVCDGSSPTRCTGMKWSICANGCRWQYAQR